VQTTLKNQTDQERSLSWIQLVLNGQDITLEKVFGLIFENETFLSLYDEDVSYLFQNRDNLIAMSKKVH